MEIMLTITEIVMGKQSIDNLNKEVFGQDYIYSPLGYDNRKLTAMVMIPMKIKRNMI